MTKYDIAIVGGGIAGLTAAIYAAKAGKKTIILEQQKVLGGRAVTNKKKGVYFNLGGHALFKGVAYDFFKELELKLEGKEPSINAYGMKNDQLYTMPMNVSSLLQTPLLSWNAKLEFAKWLAKLRKINTNSLNQVSLRKWIETNLHDPMLRNLFYSLFRKATYVIAPELQTAGPAIKQLQNSLNGVLYLDKGWGSIVEELRNIAEQNGVKWKTNCKVRSVEHKDQEVKAILMADGTRIEAAAIILTNSPSDACKLIPHSEFTSLETWKKQAIPVTAACLDVGVRRLPRPKHQFIYGLDQPILFTNHSRAAKLSDDGTQVACLLKYQGQNTDAHKDEKWMEHILDLVQPGWRNELVVRQFLPKMTVTHDFPHLKRTENPGPQIPEIKGLYVAGDWVSHGELLVDASVASAKRAVDHLISNHSREVVMVR